MAAAAEQSIQQSILEAKADVREAKEQLQGATGDEKVALQQRLAALEQRLTTLEHRLTTLEQQKLQLMQQQSAAAGGAGPSNAMLADRLGQLESAVQRLQEALSSPPRGNPRQQRSKCSHKRLSTVNEGEDSIIHQDQEQ